jgi:hypothetical protein
MTMPKKTMNDSATETVVRLGGVAEAPALPTSQEVADALGRAYDAACDVVAMLDQQRICPTPGSLEHVACAAMMERVLGPACDFATRVSRYLYQLPQPTVKLHHGLECLPGHEDDLPF